MRPAPCLLLLPHFWRSVKFFLRVPVDLVLRDRSARGFDARLRFVVRQKNDDLWSTCLEPIQSELQPAEFAAPQSLTAGSRHREPAPMKTW